MWRSASPTGRRPVHVFAAQAALLTLLLGFLPGMQTGYARFFAAHAQPVLGLLGGEREIRLEAVEPSSRGDRADLRMAGFSADGRHRLWRIHYRLWSHGWWPTAAALALVLATPLPWRRRLLALGLAAALIDAFVLLRVASIALVLHAAQNEPGAAADWAGAIELMRQSAISWVYPFATVLIAWTAVARPSTTLDLSVLRLGGRAAEEPLTPMVDSPRGDRPIRAPRSDGE